MWHVYILRCCDDSLYVGVTIDIVERLARHNDGRGSVFTAARRPVALVYTEGYAAAKPAFERERQLKKWRHAKKEALIAANVALLKKL